MNERETKPTMSEREIELRRRMFSPKPYGEPIVKAPSVESLDNQVVVTETPAKQIHWEPYVSPLRRLMDQDKEDTPLSGEV